MAALVRRVLCKEVRHELIAKLLLVRLFLAAALLPLPGVSLRPVPLGLLLLPVVHRMTQTSRVQHPSE